MNCRHCGHENDRDAEFCENCGTRLEQHCPKCNTPVKPGTRFCKKCGTAFVETEPDGAIESNLFTIQQSAPSELQEKIRISSSRMEGERKPVTILFTDIVGSTSIAEKLDPEEWKEIVNAAHKRISRAVYKYEGTIAQLLGDGVLAFFGAPVTHEDDPIRAVHAALEIQQSIREYAIDLKGYVENFQVRVGLNSGMVVVGNVGSDLHMEYLAVGDAVNLAARLQSAASPGGVLISEGTAKQVRGIFDIQPLGKISVKGKSEPLNVFEVLQRKVTPEHTRGFSELPSPLIGRSFELTTLNGALQALRAGHGQIVSITGEAGIGKSRLAEEAHAESRISSPKIRWLEGRALSYGQTLSFWIITQLFYNDLGLSDGDPEVRVHHALKRRVKELFSEKDEEILPYLAHLLGLRLEDESSEQLRLLDGETLKHQMIQAVCRYFHRLAELQPTVLVFEDLHWADPSSLEALEELLAVTDRAPLMLLLLFRLEREHGSWRIKVHAETDYSHRYTEIILRPLSPEEQDLLVDSLLAIAELPSQTKRVILERSEGNPFYLEEIVRSLIDQGIFIHDEGRWKATQDLEGITIPETLQGVLLARIDRLHEEVRHTLQLASVIGKSFPFRLLEAVDAAEKQLEQHLAQLQRVDLVREKARQPELEYIFKHSLTQEAAYNSLLHEKRREFHQRVGEALENLFSDRIDQYLGLLAYHFDSAGDLAKATTYLIRAGDRASLSDEHNEAVGYYQRAVKLLEEQKDEARLVQVWLKLGLIYHTNFQFENAHRANEMAFVLQKNIPVPPKKIPGLQPKTFHFGYMGQHVSLDPGLAQWGQDIFTVAHLFCGLATQDEELNVIPDIARSWQVLEDGRRYLFHLREDATWTDGTPVTASDFEWAWKRNLQPSLHSSTASYLLDVSGARAYHSGENPDPNCVGVRTLDDFTLEVKLEQPVAYFPFILTQPVTFALHRKTIETKGEAWWHPGSMINNGPFSLKKYDAQSGILLERNARYYGSFPGNAEQVGWTIFKDREEMTRAYLQNQIDLFHNGNSPAPIDIPLEEVRKYQSIGIFFLVFSPSMAPFDDVRVRKAFAMAINRKKIQELLEMPIYRGGLVPAGMPGHSPELNLPYEPEKARSLLAEAGYPGGRGFPLVRAIAGFTTKERMVNFSRQWSENLGVEVQIEGADLGTLTDWQRNSSHHQIVVQGWDIDYPDPDNLLRQSDAIIQLKHLGWQDPVYDALVDEATRTRDRTKRLALYRQADQQLVAEQALVLPICTLYDNIIAKSWVNYIHENVYGTMKFHDVIIEDH